MVVLLILWQLSPYFGDGPVWYQLSHSTKLCDSYWWTNLLYVNNFHPTNFSDEVIEYLFWNKSIYYLYLVYGVDMVFS